MNKIETININKFENDVALQGIPEFEFVYVNGRNTDVDSTETVISRGGIHQFQNSGSRYTVSSSDGTLDGGGVEATNSITITSMSLGDQFYVTSSGGTVYTFSASDAPIPSDSSPIFYFATASGGDLSGSVDNLVQEINDNLDFVISASNEGIASTSSILSISSSTPGTDGNSIGFQSGSSQFTLGGGQAGQDGAQIVELFGLDKSFNQITESVYLKSESVQVTTDNEFLRLNRAEVSQSGNVSGSNFGDIMIASGTTEVATIPAGFNLSQDAVYTVPASHSATLNYVSVNNLSGSVEVQVYSRKSGSVFLMIDSIRFGDSSDPDQVFKEYLLPIKLEEKSDLRFDSVPTNATNMAVSLQAGIVLRDDR